MHVAYDYTYHEYDMRSVLKDQVSVLDVLEIH